MPRTLIRAHRDEDRMRSLGWLAVAWMEHFCVHGPGSVQGQPIRHADEYTGFIVDCYAIGDHPSNNHMLHDSAFLSRAKGCDKSGMGARLALFEALGPCRFTGQWARGGEVYRDPWGLGFTYVYSPGEPMGEPVTAPYIRCMATEETQGNNVYSTIYYNFSQEYDEPLLSFVPGIDLGIERVLLPRGGEIRLSTASSAAKDGGKETFVIFDETHLYKTKDLQDMYDTVTRNLLKRKKMGTWFLETTTMFAPGENSVAEATYEEAERLREGTKKRGRHRLLFDHRWGECLDPSNEDELRAALIEAYGDALEWIDLDGLIDGIYDTRNKIENSRRYFLNARTSSSDAWIAEPVWTACKRPDLALAADDMITLGLDGSVRDDATALVGCRIADGHIELLGLWEKPLGPEGDEWQVDREAVDAAVSDAMHRFKVMGFYMDPAHWQDYADRFTNEYGDQMKIRASQRRPLEWWTNRPTAIVAALERFHEAVEERRISYTPADDRGEGTKEHGLALALTRHILNARRRIGRAGVQIGKEHPKSAKKIDGAMAAVLAYEAACDGIAMGVHNAPTMISVPRRLR